MALFKKDGKWYVDYYFEGRRIREAVGRSKKQAQQALEARKTDIRRGKFQFQDVRPTPLFRDFAQVYLEHARANKRSWERDQRTLRKHLVPFFGKRRLNQVSSFLVETYKNKRKSEAEPATVNRELALFKYMFNLAIKWGKAHHNPVKEVRLFREERGGIRWLSEEEAEALIRVAGNHLKPILVIALHTGMRRGELLNLRWDNVDLLNRMITIEHSKGGRVRQIPMTDRVFETLRLVDKSGEYVFSKKDGSPYGKVQKGFKAAVKRAGIRDCRFHDLRHTFASWLVMKGVPLATVQYYLGHQNIQTTMAYSHLSPDHRREAVRVLDGHYMDTRKDKPVRVVSVSH